MGSYIKKPDKIEAIEWTGSNMYEVIEFGGGTDDFGFHCENETMTIDTLEGTHRVNKGDFIIKGVKGEFYPCKPDIFKATYYTEAEYLSNS